jgi:hypothetical protein
LGCPLELGSDALDHLVLGAHPGSLATFPAAEIAWMVASPIAMLAVLIGVARTIRGLPLSSQVLRCESWLGLAAVVIWRGSSPARAAG